MADSELIAQCMVIANNIGFSEAVHMISGAAIGLLVGFCLGRQDLKRDAG